MILCNIVSVSLTRIRELAISRTCACNVRLEKCPVVSVEFRINKTYKETVNRMPTTDNENVRSRISVDLKNPKIPNEDS